MVEVDFASTRSTPGVSIVDPPTAAMTTFPIVLIATAPASEAPNEDAEEAEMVAAPEPASDLIVEESLAFTETLPLAKT